MTLRSTDYALLSQDSYKDPAIESHGPGGVIYKEVKLDGVTYRPLDHFDDPKTGFQATAYQREDTKEVVIAYRGTEFDREPKQDGLTDAAMTFNGTNNQTAESMAFTHRVIDAAKQRSELKNEPFNVTVTGHSLGGTLAEINAYKFGMHGETFNSFGAAGLVQGIPAGGNQVIDHVRATDVVSAASSHFGQVRAYAVPQDTQALSQAGYTDSRVVNALTHHAPVLGMIQKDAHSIDNFVPNSELLGHSIISPENEKYAQAHHTMIQPYRDNIEMARTAAFAGFQVDKPVIEAAGAVVHRAENTGREAVQMLEAFKDKAVEDYHGTVNTASRGIEGTVNFVKEHPVLLDHPAHPDYAMYQRSLGEVHRLDAKIGRTPDHQSANLAAGITVGARASGLSSVDHVLLSEDGSKAFAIQGDLRSPLKQVANGIDTGHAVNTSIEQHTQAWQQNAQQAHTQQQIQQQTQQQAPQVQQPMQQSSAPGMGR
jgi:hypothetical protein